MKKKLFVCFALAAGLMMGAIPGMQVSASGENVIAAEKVTDLDEYTFVADRSVEAFSIHGEARLALEQHSFDYEAAIEMVENGIIAPLSLYNLPTEADEESAFSFIDMEGVEEDVEVSEASIYANCAHKYQAGVLTGHAENNDGSCNVVSWDAIRCTSCGTIWVLDVIESSYYRVCPH